MEDHLGIREEPFGNPSQVFISFPQVGIRNNSNFHTEKIIRGGLKKQDIFEEKTQSNRALPDHAPGGKRLVPIDFLRPAIYYFSPFKSEEFPS